MPLLTPTLAIAARVTLGVNQVLVINTSTKVNLNTLDYNIGGLIAFDAINHRLTVPVAGKYRVAGTVYASGAYAVGDRLSLGIFKSGILARYVQKTVGGTRDESISFADDLALAAGDYIELNGDCSAATTMQTPYTFLSASLICPL